MLRVCVVLCLVICLLASADKLDRFLAQYQSVCGESLHETGNSTTTPTTELTTRIVGGTDAARGEFPWQISIRKWSVKENRWYHTCGGVILARWWILTAAHCLLSSANPNDYIIRVGEYNYTAHQGVDVSVSKVIPHPKFNLFSIDPDVGLIRLAEPLQFNSTTVPLLRPICFPPAASPHYWWHLRRRQQSGENLTCVSTGWGRLQFDGGFPSVLQKGQVRLISNKQCREQYRKNIKITEGMICTQGNGTGTCQGDSGGPLQCLQANNGQSRWTLFGLTSFAIGCAEESFPSVSSRVSYYRNWIADKIIAMN